MSEKNMWMGLVEISPQADNAELEPNERAFTSILLFADSEQDFRDKVAVFVAKEKFNLVNVLDVENYSELVDEYEFEEDVEEAAVFLEETGKPQMTVLDIFEAE